MGNKIDKQISGRIVLTKTTDSAENKQPNNVKV
jgi:hypothetical protein